MVLGTPPYMSPEQFTGKALDARSDVYSLGVMAYEMLSGRLPFEADTPWQWATQHMTAQPIPFEVSAPAANIPEGMRQAIFRALSKDRDQRQQSARQFFAQLSEGERFTAPQAPDGRAGTGTAAMAQSPELAATVPPGFGPAAQAPMAAPAQMAAPMAPGPMPPQPYQPTPGAFGAPIPAVPPRRSGRGGKGLIIGLAVVVVLLGIGGAVFALRQMRPPPDEPQALTNPFASASSPTVAAVQAETPGATTQQPAQTVEEPTTTAAGHLPRGTKPGKPAASASAQPSAQASASSTTASSGPDSCDECISAARSGNIVGASSLYAKCSDPSKKDKCSRSARGTAGGPIKSAVLNGNGDCTKANAIAAAARQMDVSSAVIDNALGSCKK
jgi:serine/threonine-protein kinase